MATFPTSNDNLNDSKTNFTVVLDDHAPHHNSMASAINAIETYLLTGRGGGSFVIGSNGTITVTVPSVANATALTGSLTLAAGQSQTAIGLGVTIAASSAYNASSGHSDRASYLLSAFTGTNGIGTHAGHYVEVKDQNTGGTIGHALAVVGRIYAEGNGGTTQVAAAFYGTAEVGHSGHTISTDVSMFRANSPTVVASATVPILAGFLAESFGNTNNATITEYAAVHVQVPSDASNGETRAGVFIGAKPTGITPGAPEVVGLRVGSYGAVITGSPTVKANTLSTQAMLALQAGTGTANDSTWLWWYRGSTALGYVGFTANSSDLLADLTKAVTDMRFNTGNNTTGMVLQNNGRLALSGGLHIGGAEDSSVGNGQSVNVKRATTTVNGAAAGTLTATSLIPAGSLVLGVNVKVTTAFGNGSGLTTFSVGDGTDPDKWGATLNRSTAATTMTAFTTASPTYYTAATNVVLTADAGTFEASGVARVTVFYLDMTSAAS